MNSKTVPAGRRRSLDAHASCMRKYNVGLVSGPRQMQGNIRQQLTRCGVVREKVAIEEDDFHERHFQRHILKLVLILEKVSQIAPRSAQMERSGRTGSMRTRSRAGSIVTKAPSANALAGCASIDATLRVAPILTG